MCSLTSGDDCMHWVLANSRDLNCMSLIESLGTFYCVINYAESGTIIDKQLLAHSMLYLIGNLLILNLSRYLSVIDCSYNLRYRHVHYRVDLWSFNSARCTCAHHRLSGSGLPLALPVKFSFQLLRVHAIMQVHNGVTSIRCGHAVYVFND